MLAVILILIGAALRLLPHSANFAPIAALALFGGVYLRPAHALTIPLAAMIASDAIIGFGSLRSRLIVYGALALIGLVGLVVKRHKSITAIAIGTLSGSAIFFLVTNFVFFYPPTMYPHTVAGMFLDYERALPFLRNTVLGDVFFAIALFGAYELAAKARDSAKVTTWTANFYPAIQRSFATRFGKTD